MKTDHYIVVGVMSGTSMDGLDLALCSFDHLRKKWRFSILKTQTIAYDNICREKLTNAHKLSSIELKKLDLDFGEYIGKQVNRFLKYSKLQPDLIASHGHTIFHQPENGITLQVGNGQAIANLTGIKTVADFRTKDVLLGGQGAPLVPIGDKLLFSEYNYCLNLGGFANISYKNGKSVLAHDICPANIVLNKLWPPYDENGINGSMGNLIIPLLLELRKFEYYSKEPPKSLGKEWVDNCFLPVVNKYSEPVEDILRTVYEHIVLLIAGSLKPDSLVLVSGGGAYNSFMIDLLKKRSNANLIIPEPDIIEFKEALIFGLLGTLRSRNNVNCLASVTGARKDSCCGVVYLP